MQSDPTTHGVEASNLSFSYGSTPLFSDLNLNVRERLALFVGPSGCGKTTILKLIGGYLKPTDQSTFINNPFRTGMILQNDMLVPWLSGTRNIELFLKRPIASFRSHPLFGMIEPILNQPVYTLSFGQRRMIELVRAFCSDRELLLLDEPFNYLDENRRERFANHIINNTKIRIICTSHYFGEFTNTHWEQFRFEGDPPHTHLIS
ncbi:ATP-binding cassette domain-containing protein [Haloferula helveola]